MPPGAPAFRYRFIADELPDKGITAGEDRVQCLCREHRIWSVFSKKRGLNRRPGPPVHDDLVERDFTSAALQKNVLDRRRWVTGQDLRLAITTWIERTYFEHNRRLSASTTGDAS